MGCASSKTTVTEKKRHRTVVSDGETLGNAAVGKLAAEDHRLLTLEHIVLSNLPKRGLTMPDPYLHIIYSEDSAFNYTSREMEDDQNPTFRLGVSFVVPKSSGTIICEVRDKDEIAREPICTVAFSVADVIRSVVSDPLKTAVLKGKCPGSSGVTYNSEWRIEDWKLCYGAEDSGAVLQVDTWTSMAISTARKQLEKRSQPYAAEKFPIPHEPPGKLELLTLPGVEFIKMADHDPDLKLPLGSSFFMRLLSKLPFDMKSTVYESRGQGNAFLKKNLPDAPEPIEGHWEEDVTSDRSFVRFCFHGPGSGYMHKTEEGYECRVLWLSRYETVKPYLRYGGLAFFDHEGKPLKIECNQGEVYTTSQGREWEWAKLYMRTSLFVAASGVHNQVCHFRWANEPHIALRECLGIHHPLRRLLCPHFFRSALVQLKALNSMTLEKGMFHRTLALEYKSLSRLMTDLFSDWQWTYYLDEIKERGMDKAPSEISAVYEDASGLHHVITCYVREYCKLYYGEEEDAPEIDQKKFQGDTELKAWWLRVNDFMPNFPRFERKNLVPVIAEIIFRVTGWHNHIGNVGAWLHDVAMINPKLEKGVLLSPVENSLVAAMLGILTSEPMPKLLETWNQMFLDREAKAVFGRFHEELQHLSARIQEQNMKRPFRFSDFDPEKVTVSVSS